MSDSASAARQLSHLCRLHARPDASRCLTVREGQPCASYSPDWLNRVDVAGRPAVRFAEPLGLDVGRRSFGRTFGPASTGGSWVPVGRVAEPLGLDVGRRSFGRTFGPASTGGSSVPVGCVAEPLGLDVARHSFGRTFGPASTGGSSAPAGRDLALRYERPAPAVARRDEPPPEPSSWPQVSPARGQPPSYGIFGFAVGPPRGEAERRGLARR